MNDDKQKFVRRKSVYGRFPHDGPTDNEPMDGGRMEDRRMDDRRMDVRWMDDDELMDDGPLGDGPELPPELMEIERKAREQRWARPLKRFGWLAIAVFVVAIMFDLSSESSDYMAGSSEARQALANRVSTSLSAGVVLLSQDEQLSAKDYTIVHQSNEASTTIQVWDYAAEDGDYVQILHNGAPITDAFMIKHKPRVLTVPAVGEVQVRGVRDGGGGITYAVRYDLNGTIYFNSAPEGELNTYTLIRE
jgi:hypothetical protein